MKNNNQVVKIIISSVFILVVAVLGSIFVNLGMDWFNQLLKPTQWIPNFVIPVVWTIIYLAFAIINFLWIRKGGIPKKVVDLMIVNGVLNVVWCLVFFTLQQLFLGNVIIIINAIFALRLIFEIAKEDAMYGLILSIYPIWLCIATSLNTALWILN